METIKDLDVYLQRMEVGMLDKLFFLQEIDMNDVDIIVDFGCADGTLLTHIKDLYTDKICVGYDIDREMLNRIHNPYILKISELKVLADFLDGYEDMNALVVFSSVLHELNSYLTKEERDHIWHTICGNSTVKYIAIRDMRLSGPCDAEDAKNAYEAAMAARPIPFADYLYHRNGYDMPDEEIFEFFLKYKYIENWKRERDEHYFYGVNTFIMPNTFKPIYYDRFYIEPQMAAIEKDFGIDLRYMNTHYKAVYKRLRG